MMLLAYHACATCMMTHAHVQSLVMVTCTMKPAPDLTQQL